MNNPLVSVVIPLYNCERFLAQAIESVLAQTYRPFEIIVVDDGSTDGGAVIAKSYDGAQCIRQEHQGQAVALNTGVKAARGAFLAFLDSDDMWSPNKLDLQIAYLLQHPAAGYVIGKTLNFVEPGTPRPARITADLMPGVNALLSPGVVVVRREVFEEVGYFDARYEHSKDADWFVRAKECGVIMGTVPETLLHRRIHGQNMSHQVDARTTEYVRTLKALLDRRRARASQGSMEEK